MHLASTAFVGLTWQRLQRALHPDTLTTPIVFHDSLDDNTLGTVTDFPTSVSPTGKIIYLTSRTLIDPEQLAHTLVEELIHVERFVRGREFDMTLEYSEQVHEKSARRGSRYFLGYERPYRNGIIVRIASGSPKNLFHVIVPEARFETI